MNRQGSMEGDVRVAGPARAPLPSRRDIQPSPQHSTSLILFTGTLVSLIIHALLILVFVRYSQLAEARLASSLHDAAATEFLLIPFDEPQPPPEPPSLRLGLADGAPDARAWLGFTDETEHLAQQGPLDQSAMTLAPPGAEAPTPTPESLAAAQASAAPEPEFPPADPRDPPEDPMREWSAELAQTAQRVGESLREALALAMDAALELPELAAPEARDSTQPAPQLASAPASNPAPAASTPASGSDLPGIVSERESIAAAVRAAPTIRPGRVLAAEGLEIQTRAPRWSLTTMSMRRPRNPTVEIFFGADGRVRRAAFVRDDAFIYNTGHDDVDQPLLNAIYSWTARGRAIDELPSQQDGEARPPEVRLLITIILVS